MKHTIFKGAAVALITPFNADGSINYEEFGKIIDDQINGGTDALVVCGTTGEPSTMPDEEHIEAMKFAVDYTKKRVPVIAGTGSNDTAYCIELSEKAEKMGADALLLVTPYYNKCTQKGLKLHYEAVAKKVDLPMILYSVKSRTGVNIAPETLAELSKIDNIVAVKEASGDISQVAKIASLCGDRLDIYSGNDDQIIPILALGGIGVISVLSNVAPRLTHDMVMDYLNGNREKALATQLSVLDLVDALFCEVNPIPVKTAMNLLGYNAGPLRLPLCEMEEKNLETLKAALKHHNLI
ncbi:MAG: 4-hydroxy-tetrahydrodipicolinate synthase [Clostridia bacterium]|nr:4-hydroxy-tetrahydrodipicolinate synthase [Clostridia bacterium]